MSNVRPLFADWKNWDDAKRCCIMMFDDSYLVGAVTASVWSDVDGVRVRYLKKYIKEKEYPIGSVDLLGVDENFRGTGVGTRLLSEILFWIGHKRCRFVISEVWEYQDKKNSKPLFNKYGFKQVAEVCKPWEQFCDGTLFKCVGYEECSGCTCDSIVMKRKLINPL
jgi:GNAT superfamily N-acetyltransferase